MSSLATGYLDIDSLLSTDERAFRGKKAAILVADADRDLARRRDLDLEIRGDALANQ